MLTFEVDCFSKAMHVVIVEAHTAPQSGRWHQLSAAVFEPLLAALDILVEQLREVADDEGEDDRGEELGASFEFRLYACTHVDGEGRVCRRDRVRLDRLRVLVQELHV